MNDSSTLVTPAEQPMTWSGWGDPTLRPGLSPRAEAHLARWIGPLERHTPPVALEDVRTSPSRLDDTTRAALTAIVGQEGVRDGPGFVEHRDRRGIVREEVCEDARFGERHQSKF